MGMIICFWFFYFVKNLTIFEISITFLTKASRQFEKITQILKVSNINLNPRGPFRCVLPRLLPYFIGIFLFSIDCIIDCALLSFYELELLLIFDVDKIVNKRILFPRVTRHWLDFDSLYWKLSNYFLGCCFIFYFENSVMYVWFGRSTSCFHWFSSLIF